DLDLDGGARIARRVDLAAHPQSGDAGDGDEHDGDGRHHDEHLAAPGGLGCQLDPLAVVPTRAVVPARSVPPATAGRGRRIGTVGLGVPGVLAVLGSEVGRAVPGHGACAPGVVARRWSSQACSMTAAATLSTMLRRRRDPTPAAERSWWAVTVVNRSSQVSTATPVARPISAASRPAEPAARPSAPDGERGNPTTITSAPVSSARAAMRWWSVRRSPERSTTS